MAAAPQVPIKGAPPSPQPPLPLAVLMHFAYNNPRHPAPAAPPHSPPAPLCIAAVQGLAGRERGQDSRHRALAPPRAADRYLGWAPPAQVQGGFPPLTCKGVSPPSRTGGGVPRSCAGGGRGVSRRTPPRTTPAHLDCPLAYQGCPKRGATPGPGWRPPPAGGEGPASCAPDPPLPSWEGRGGRRAAVMVSRPEAAAAIRGPQ